jgi:hypothetical protein
VQDDQINLRLNASETGSDGVALGCGRWSPPTGCAGRLKRSSSASNRSLGNQCGQRPRGDAPRGADETELLYHGGDHGALTGGGAGIPVGALRGRIMQHSAWRKTHICLQRYNRVPECVTWTSISVSTSRFCPGSVGIWLQRMFSVLLRYLMGVHVTDLELFFLLQSKFLLVGSGATVREILSNLSKSSCSVSSADKSRLSGYWNSAATCAGRNFWMTHISGDNTGGTTGIWAKLSCGPMGA